MRAEVRVLVADDHPAFRMGMAMALRQLGFGLVDEVEDGKRAVEAFGDARYDVVILDLKMPCLDGLQVARMILGKEAAWASGGIGPVVVLLSTFDQPALVRAAREVGVTDFLGKEIEPARLARRLDRRLSERRLVRHPPEPARVEVVGLSTREREVLHCLCRGASTRDIATTLGISGETVKDHLTRIYAKLEVADRASAVDAAHRLGWVMLEDLRQG